MLYFKDELESLNESYFGFTNRIKIISESVNNIMMFYNSGGRKQTGYYELDNRFIRYYENYYNKYKHKLDNYDSIEFKTLRSQFKYNIINLDNNPVYNLIKKLKTQLEIAISIFFGFTYTKIDLVEIDQVDLSTVVNGILDYRSNKGILSNNLFEKPLSRKKILNAFIVDNNGLRFNRNLYIVISYIIISDIVFLQFELNLTPIEVTSIILHEISHQFSIYIIPPKEYNIKTDEIVADKLVSLYGISSDYCSALSKINTYEITEKCKQLSNQYDMISRFKKHDKSKSEYIYNEYILYMLENPDINHQGLHNRLLSQKLQLEEELKYNKTLSKSKRDYIKQELVEIDLIINNHYNDHELIKRIKYWEKDNLNQGMIKDKSINKWSNSRYIRRILELEKNKNNK